MGKIPDAKEAKIIVSAPAKAKLTTVRPILVPFTIINNNPWEVDIIECASKEYFSVIVQIHAF